MGFGIAIILQNCIWTTTDCDDMTGCDAYFAYCGEGNFVPLKHYDLDDEEDLLNKYFPEKLKTKKSKSGGGKAKPKEKREKQTLQQQFEPEHEAQHVYMPAHSQKHPQSQQ